MAGATPVAAGIGTPDSWLQAARAAATAARSLCGALVTPSQTTSTANEPSGLAASAIASSFAACTIPLSQTPPTHGAGRSLQWSRGDRAFCPQVPQKPSSRTFPPQCSHVPLVTLVRAGLVVSSPASGPVAAAAPTCAPHASQNVSLAAIGAPHDGQRGSASVM